MKGRNWRSLVSLRSFDNRAGDRLQEQLAIQDSKFIDLFGGNLIVDVALIGLDAFLREGATMGVMLQAQQSAGARHPSAACRPSKTVR